MGRNSGLKFGKYVKSVWSYKCVFRHLGVCLYGFERDMSERVHLKVLYFYILEHITLTRKVGAPKGDVRGYGVYPPSQMFTIIFNYVRVGVIIL